MALSKFSLVFVALGTLLAPLPALADIAPADQCTATDLDKPCDNAIIGGAENQPGVCKAAMCTRATPSGSMTYACYRCEAEGQGTGGQGTGGQANDAGTGGQADDTGVAGQANDAGSAGTSETGGTTNTSGSAAGGSASNGSGDSGGCSVAVARGTGGLLGLLAALGLISLRRRRSSKS